MSDQFHRNTGEEAGWEGAASKRAAAPLSPYRRRLLWLLMLVVIMAVIGAAWWLQRQTHPTVPLVEVVAPGNISQEVVNRGVCMLHEKAADMVEMWRSCNPQTLFIIMGSGQKRLLK